jgi:hypothetical protein
MLRNLMNPNVLPPRMEARFCLKNTGNPDSNAMRSEVTTNMGENARITRVDPMISNERFTTLLKAST